MADKILSLLGALTLLTSAGGCLSGGTLGHAENGQGGELPPAKAGAACLATARELEDKGYEIEAIDQYERARRFDAHLKVPAARRLAVLYDRQGNADRARAEYQEALQRGPPDTALLNDYGYFCYEQGQLEEAEKLLRQAVQKNNAYRRAWVNLGTVLAQEGKTQESLDAFGKVLTPADSFTNLGVLLAKQGQTDQARQALRQAIVLEPNASRARVFLAALDETPARLSGR